jgi:hypothetical protein
MIPLTPLMIARLTQMEDPWTLNGTAGSSRGPRRPTSMTTLLSFFLCFVYMHLFSFLYINIISRETPSCSIKNEGSSPLPTRTLRQELCIGVSMGLWSAPSWFCSLPRRRSEWEAGHPLRSHHRASGTPPGAWDNTVNALAQPSLAPTVKAPKSKRYQRVSRTCHWLGCLAWLWTATLWPLHNSTLTLYCWKLDCNQ